MNGLNARELQAGLWAAGSLVAYLLPTCAAWATRVRLRVSGKARWLEFGARAGRWAVWIGSPYLALGGWPMRNGALPASAMGLTALAWSWQSWVDALGHGAPVGLAVLLGIGLVRFYVGRANAARGRRVPMPSGSARPWWELLVETTILDVHWAFYWAAMAVVSDDRYAGVWLGLGLIYLELILNPFWRRGLRSPERTGACWEQAALALGIAMVFWQTGSLFICIGVHWMLGLVLGQKSARVRQAARAAE